MILNYIQRQIKGITRNVKTMMQVLFNYEKGKELGPRTANMTLSICLKIKMIEKVLKSDYSTNESLLILCGYDVIF